MKILGLNLFHGDASACLFVDDKLIAAAEEERFNRIKHSAGIPVNSINFCLQYGNLKIDEIDHIAINRDPKKRFHHKILFSFKKLFKVKFLKSRMKNLNKITSVKKILQSNFNEKINARINYVDHHIAHVSSSVYFSPFKETNFISIDGFGDFASTSAGYYDGKKLINCFEVLFPHSLGIFYTAITQYLGFKNYGDEYKVMGLAPYGNTNFYDKVSKLIITEKNKFKLNLDFFTHHTKGVEMTWLEGEPKIGKIYSDKLVELLGPPRQGDESISQIHKDIAASTQKVFENTVEHMIKSLKKINPSKNLSISGGCGMNSVANGKIKALKIYENLYIPPAPGDSGGAIGAAAYIINKKKPKKFNDNPYLGPSFTSEHIQNKINKYELKFKEKKIEVTYYSDKNTQLNEIASLISKNKIIGFFNGRMEWGPRALGNRSILANPGDKNIREILNLKIKRRESFRPFAPSILDSHVEDWFEIKDDVPFMSKVYQVREEKKQIIPAVTHVDGSGRLQTVNENFNPIFSQLIKNFYNITKIPILLNTSFNENEPIVCSPDEAIDCFLRTNMDLLSLENFLLFRKS